MLEALDMLAIDQLRHRIVVSSPLLLILENISAALPLNLFFLSLLFFMYFSSMSLSTLPESFLDATQFIDPLAWWLIVFFLFLFLIILLRTDGFEAIGHRCRVSRDGPYATGCP
jgi:hypothetical protein